MNISQNTAIQTSPSHVDLEEAYQIDTLLEYALNIYPVFYKLPLGIVISIGILANVLLIYYLFRSGKVRAVTFCIITTLAISDLITCMSGLVLYMWILFVMSIRTPAQLCKISVYFHLAAMTSSLYHLVLFAGIRFYQLVYPLKAKANLTLGIVSKMCILIWMLSLLGNMSYFWQYTVLNIHHGSKILRICSFLGSFAVKDILIHVMIFWFPCVAIMTLHLIKFIKVRNQTKNMDLANNDRKGTVVSAMWIMIIAFFVCWLPSLIHDMAHGFFKLPYPINHYFIYYITDSIIMLNSTTNPFIYMLIAKPIRQDILNYILPSCFLALYKR